jgi:di/tripeptidase
MYGLSFETTDRYQEGSVLTAGEAAALNRLRNERIGHLLRSRLPDSVGKGTVIEPGTELHTEVMENLAKFDAEYEFAVSGEAAPRRTPVEQEAIDIARQKVKAKAAQSGLRVGKRAKGDEPEETGPGVYPYSKYNAKVEEVAKMPAIVKDAERIVAQRQKSQDKSEEFDLDAA